MFHDLCLPWFENILNAVTTKRTDRLLKTASEINLSRLKAVVNHFRFIFILHSPLDTHFPHLLEQSQTCIPSIGAGLRPNRKIFPDLPGHWQAIATYALGNGDQRHIYLPDTVRCLYPSMSPSSLTSLFCVGYPAICYLLAVTTIRTDRLLKTASEINLSRLKAVVNHFRFIFILHSPLDTHLPHLLEQSQTCIPSIGAGLRPNRKSFPLKQEFDLTPFPAPHLWRLLVAL